MYSYLVLIPTFICVQYSLALDNGDPESCSLNTGERGKCLNIRNCSYALDLLKNNERPKICGFEKDDPRVCCIEEKQQPLAKIPGALSLSKCTEYHPIEQSLGPISLLPSEPSIKQYPHMAAIGFGEKDNIQWLCGGSLISKNFVLTAAHCLYSRELGSPTWVRLGDTDLASDSDIAEPQNFTVRRGIAHPDYKPPSRYHDIALLELDREVILSAFVSIACLDNVRKHEEKRMKATGWIEFTTENNNNLLTEVNLDILAQDKCQQSYVTIPTRILPKGIVDEIYICASEPAGKYDCQSHSGGPLQVRNPNEQNSVNVYKIVGVTSFGRRCGDRFPMLYTRVYNYLSWIENTVWPS